MAIPACAQKCYNGFQPSYGCNFVDTACYCKQSVATQLVSCAQSNCDQTDLQSYIGWANNACAAAGTSFDASAPGIVATTTPGLSGAVGSGPTAASTAVNNSPISITTQIQAMTGSLTSPVASLDPSSSATVTSSGNGSAASGGLTTSDQIAIGIGVPVGVATILGTWFMWRAHQRKKNRSKDEVALYQLKGREVHP